MKWYFNFKDPGGEIWKITNELDESTPYIEVEPELYKEFSTDQKRMQDYIIVPTGKADLKYELQLKHQDLLTFDVDISVHQIQKVNTIDTNNAFVIEQDIKNGVWSISMSEQLRMLLTQTAYYKDKSQLIYVTDQDDPNILLDTIEVKLYNILFSESFVLPDQLVKVAQNLNVSLYCGKIFENYYHMVKNYEN
jgi:hypothetical protein